MKKLIDKIEELGFNPREQFLLGLTLLITGIILGMLLSPKGIFGSYNGNNYPTYLPNDDEDPVDDDQE